MGKEIYLRTKWNNMREKYLQIFGLTTLNKYFSSVSYCIRYYNLLPALSNIVDKAGAYLPLTGYCSNGRLALSTKVRQELKKLTVTNALAYF